MFLAAQLAKSRSSLTAVEDKLANVENWSKSKFPDLAPQVANIANSLSQFGRSLADITEFQTLNLTALRKLLKKHDRHAGVHSAKGYLAEQSSNDSRHLERLLEADDFADLVFDFKQALERTQKLEKAILLERHISFDNPDNESSPLLRCRK